MINKSYLLIISFLLTFILQSTAQHSAQSQLPVDTVKNLAAIKLCNELLVNDSTGPLFNRVSVFGNPNCAQCREVEALMKDRKIDFDLYDLRDNKLLMSIHNVIVAKRESEKAAYSYPIILHKGRLYFNFKDAGDVVEELKYRMTH